MFLWSTTKPSISMVSTKHYISEAFLIDFGNQSALFVSWGGPGLSLTSCQLGGFCCSVSVTVSTVVIITNVSLSY